MGQGNRRHWQWLALLWWGVSCYLLLKPPSGEPAPFAHFDKLGHCLLFLLQAVLLLRAWPRQPWWRAGCLLAAWAVLSECLQAWLTTTRHGDVLDVLADLAGVSVAFALGWAARGRSGKLLSFSGRQRRPQ